MSTYMGLTNFQKTIRFFGPPCRIFISASRRTAADYVLAPVCVSVWNQFLQARYLKN